VVTVHELTRVDARRIAVRAQLVDGARPAGLLDVVRGANHGRAERQLHP
jgi:hypothetical protein